MVLVFNLAPVQLAGEGCDVRIRHVDSQFEEVCLDGDLLLSVNDVPHMELRDHRLGGLMFVTYVVLLELFSLLRINGCDNGFDLHGIHHLLEVVIFPVDLVVLLELE